MSFDRKAADWDRSRRRQALADAVAAAIRSEIPLAQTMRLLDIGAGTGLLTERLLPYVGQITAIDRSEGMLARFRDKFRDEAHRVEALYGDILDLTTDRRFDGIVSSMTLHHIGPIEALFRRLSDLLIPGGFVALADLTPEDGTFHDDGNEGVHHFGFTQTWLQTKAQPAGFSLLSWKVIHTIEKSPTRTYDIFLSVFQKIQPIGSNHA